tara:strand:+ start:2736 stop:4031 length:1296 start_codon:yes stop_codon:yes gene_type:complete
MSTFDLGSAGTTAINTILAEEANRINQDVYSRTVHTSAWMDLMKQTAFPDGMGYQLSTLVYDRAIPTTDSAGDTAGVTWSALGTLNSASNSFGTSDLGQPLKDAADDVQGGRGTGAADKRSFVQFSKQLKKYNIDRAVIESPRISLEDLRFAAHRQEQLRAIMDNMAESTRYTWENRYRDEFSKVADSYIGAVASGTAIQSGFEGTELAGTVDLGTAGSFTVPTSNISNALLDKSYFNLVRKGAGSEAYGRENGRPVFGLVLSSEASYQLQTEAGFRDDVRYNNSKVSDLIAPLGVEKSFRGFYHLVDDLAPRFTLANTDQITRVLPYTVSSGVTTPNSAYESAEYEAAFILHPHVCESQIPNPFSGAQGISFDPISYRGDFKWTNIPNEITNPDGTIGFFRGVLASATKPIKTDLGFVILFKRTSTTPAA